MADFPDAVYRHGRGGRRAVHAAGPAPHPSAQRPLPHRQIHGTVNTAHIDDAPRMEESKRLIVSFSSGAHCLSQAYAAPFIASPSPPQPSRYYPRWRPETFRGAGQSANSLRRARRKDTPRAAHPGKRSAPAPAAKMPDIPPVPSPAHAWPPHAPSPQTADESPRRLLPPGCPARIDKSSHIARRFPKASGRCRCAKGDRAG